MNEPIGHTDCPVCGRIECAINRRRKAKAYLVCDNCGYEGFSRGTEADIKLWAKVRRSRSSMTIW